MKKVLTIGCLAILLCSCVYKSELMVTVTNSSKIDRTQETVSLMATNVKSQLKIDKAQQIIVTDIEGNQLPYQWIYKEDSIPQELIFQVSLKAGETKEYKIKAGIPMQFKSCVSAQFVPQRKDDMSWENDRIAFRTYGPALEATGEVSNGIDVWLKRTSEMVCLKWYNDELAKISTYHQDNGQGLDCYKVGRTLGAGAMAPFVNDSLWLANNYVSYRILSNGPIRTTIELTYAPFNVNGTMISEIRTISLDAGSQLNKIEEKYSTQTVMPVAAGLVKRASDENIVVEAEDGYVAYTEPAQGDAGVTYLALVFDTAIQQSKITPAHILAVTEYNPTIPYFYYAGAGWSKWGFATPADWNNYVANFAARLREPLSVSLN